MFSSFSRRGSGLVDPQPSRTDFTADDEQLVNLVRPFTMTSPERIVHLARAVEYVVRNRIPGSIVECGVWRGGSMMCVAHVLLRLDERDRDLYLFDTYDGMPPADDVDRRYDGARATAILASEKKETSQNWACASLDDVRRNMGRTGYPEHKLHFIAGRVENTIPLMAPEAVALLRLDTDWYASTRHELVHLYPRLQVSGALIIDDYGWWLGARQAVDEYFRALAIAPLLHRIDETGRGCVKPPDVLPERR